MAKITTLSDIQKEDLRFCCTPNRWPMWPFCPLKRKGADGLEVGFLMDNEALMTKPNPLAECYRTLHLASFFALGSMTKEERKAIKKKTYESITEMLLDGWMVD